MKYIVQDDQKFKKDNKSANNKAFKNQNIGYWCKVKITNLYQTNWSEWSSVEL